MKEAVEIAKLRLFLKLVATVEANYAKDNLGLEPLPDIDFNIRAGNTLIGYATEGEIDKAFSGKFDFDNDAEKIKEKCEIVARTFTRYKDIQLSYGNDFNDFKEAKSELNKRLKELNEELSRLLHKQTSSLAYDKWLETHQPFHWFAEFYEIIHDKGGFDVIIGNPPYVEYNKIKNDKVNGYTLNGYKTILAGDLYAYVMERSISLLDKTGYCGFIVRLSSIVSKKTIALRQLLFNTTKSVNISMFSASAQPSCLFEGVRDRLTIFLIGGASQKITTTNFLKWFTNEREELFSNIVQYTGAVTDKSPTFIPKIGNKYLKSAFNKMVQNKELGHFVSKTGRYSVYYHESPVHWHKAWNQIPYYYQENLGVVKSVSLREMTFNEEKFAKAMLCIGNSSTFYWFYNTTSDCRHLTWETYSQLPVGLNKMSEKNLNLLSSLSSELSEDYDKHKELYTRVSKSTGESRFDAYYPSKSKTIIDEIDKVLANHYGFTDEELDSIINYDIKYRMGRELGDEDDEESTQS
jgi:hypothetical protein